MDLTVSIQKTSGHPLISTHGKFDMQLIDSTDRDLICDTMSHIKSRSVLNLFHPNFIEICYDAIVYDIF